MKKFLFLLSFLTLGALTTMNAQSTEAKASCKKGEKSACCAKKGTASATATAATAKSTKKCCSKAHGVSTAAKEGKSCSKSKSVAGVVMTASEAAEADKTVEERVCSKSGKVSYYQSAECPVTGKLSVSEVLYDSEKGQFVNVSPKELKECSKADQKACKKKLKKAKVVKTSVVE